LIKKSGDKKFPEQLGISAGKDLLKQSEGNYKKKRELTEFDTENKFNYLDKIKNNNSKVSSFLTVQEGCDKFCSFCVVPYTRGPEYSRPFKKIIEEAENLINNAKYMLGDLPEHEDEWLGFRPTLPDFLPVMGPSKNYKNVFYCFGHHHLGWTLGPISGKIVSGMIAKENTNLNLDPYSSIRFN